MNIKYGKSLEQRKLDQNGQAYFILPSRKGRNFFRWFWLSTNLFITVKFHDIQKSINQLPKGGQIHLLRGTYLLHKVVELKDNIDLIGVPDGTAIRSCIKDPKKIPR